MAETIIEVLDRLQQSQLYQKSQLYQTGLDYSWLPAPRVRGALFTFLGDVKWNRYATEQQERRNRNDHTRRLNDSGKAGSIAASAATL